MEQLQLAFNQFSSSLFNEMSELRTKVVSLEEDLKKSKGQQILNRKEASNFLGVSNPTFQRYINDGLPVHGTPKKQIFFKDEILTYIKDKT